MGRFVRRTGWGIPGGIVGDFRSTALLESGISSGKIVVLLGDSPAFEVDPVSRFSTAQIPVRHSLAEWLGGASADDPGFDSPELVREYSNSRQVLRFVAAHFADVRLFDVEPGFCTGPGLCPYRLGDRLLYSDWNHLTPDGALYALRDFKLPRVPAAGK